MRLHVSSVLQSIITFNDKSLRKNFLFGYFFGLFTNSYLCFLYTGSYLFVMTGNFLWPHFFSIWFSFNHNVPIPSTIASMSLLMMMMMTMINSFCDMVDRRKAFSLISSQDHCQRSSPSQISDRSHAWFEPVQNLSSGLVEWSWAVVITITPWRSFRCFKRVFICFFANINHFIHTHKKPKKIFDYIKYSIVFDCFSLIFLF